MDTTTLLIYLAGFFVACWILSLVPEKNSGIMRTIALWKWPITAAVGYYAFGIIGALIVGLLWVRRSTTNVAIAIADRKEMTAAQAISDLESIQLPDAKAIARKAHAGAVSVVKGAQAEVS